MTFTDHLHEDIVSQATLVITPQTRPQWLAISGDLDLSNHAALCRALAQTARSGGDIHLDMRHVTFSDATAAIALTHAAHLAAPHRLILHRPPPLLAWMLRRLHHTATNPDQPGQNPDTVVVYGERGMGPEERTTANIS